MQNQQTVPERPALVHATLVWTDETKIGFYASRAWPMASVRRADDGLDAVFRIHAGCSAVRSKSVALSSGARTARRRADWTDDAACLKGATGGQAEGLSRISGSTLNGLRPDWSGDARPGSSRIN